VVVVTEEVTTFGGFGRHVHQQHEVGHQARSMRESKPGNI
jgi:hypothetical protein